ncbi:MAG TPA: HNH endonuclease [Verrucomicrobiales bacterium]|nr:HNH endonuclease [Verrucomicrobiales bacterium]
MATTQGHGNPDWTREETILALALYFEIGGKKSSKHDRIKELSELLRRMPYHAIASRQQSFRNADGVSFKLQNLRSVATGEGLSNVSKIDREIWGEFGSRPEELRIEAIRLKDAVISLEKLISEPEDQDQFKEGRLITELHKRRERNKALRAKLLKSRRKKGPLRCEICDVGSNLPNTCYEDAIFEAHHTNPMSEGERITNLNEVVLLCANCHRLLHRAIATNKKWLAVSDARTLLSEPSS